MIFRFFRDFFSCCPDCRDCNRHRWARPTRPTEPRENGGGAPNEGGRAARSNVGSITSAATPQHYRLHARVQTVKPLGAQMSGRHGSSAAPRLVQRAAHGSSRREHRASRFVVAGPASGDVEQAALAVTTVPVDASRHDATSEPQRLSPRSPYSSDRPRATTERAFEGDPEAAIDESSWGSRRRGQRAAPAAQLSSGHALVAAATPYSTHAGDAVVAPRPHERTSWSSGAGAGSGGSGANAAGSLVWGARIDERLDRLERLVELATAQHHSSEEKLTSVIRRCSDQREELEELRFELRRKPPEAAAPPPLPTPDRQQLQDDGALDVRELAAQLHALQRQCDALGPQLGEMQASQRHDIADKVARAVSKESKRMRVELSTVRDELNSTAEQNRRLGREAETSISTVKRRMDEWELSSTKTEQTLMAELHELSRTSAEAVKRLSTVESDYQIFLMKMERHEQSAQEMDEHFADFALAKEEIDQGIELLAKQQKEFHVDRAKTDAALAHLQEETGSLHASTTAFRGELDSASRAAHEREAEFTSRLEELGDSTREHLEQATGAQDEARATLEDRLQQLVASTADEVLEKARAEDGVCTEALSDALEQSAAKLQDR
jgi:hypothetical protein